MYYLEKPKGFSPVEKYYVANILDKDLYSSNLKIFDKEYYVINTFDSFISFARLNHMKKHVDTNNLFYRNFKNSFSTQKIVLENGTIDKFKDFYNEYEAAEYTFAVIDDVVLILTYEAIKD